MDEQQTEPMARPKNFPDAMEAVATYVEMCDRLAAEVLLNAEGIEHVPETTMQDDLRRLAFLAREFPDQSTEALWRFMETSRE